MSRCSKSSQDESEIKMDASCNIITKCTTNPRESDLHVITMGTAGSLFPFFKPNFEQCALYAHQLNKGYSKVVAFLPTGWANSNSSSQFKNNDNNIVATKEISMEHIKSMLPPQMAKKGCFGNNSSIHVEVRPVPYSEHSSFTELRSCVKFFKPRQIIPTVFSNEKEYNAIENRFSDLVDSQRAKIAFIQSISGGNRGGVSTNKIMNNDDKKRSRSGSHTEGHSPTNLSKKNKITHKKSEASCSDRDQSHQKSVKTEGQSKPILKIDDAKVALLVSMGFTALCSRQSLEIKKNNLEDAIELLLQKRS